MLDWKMMKIGLIKKVFFLVFPLPETNVLFELSRLKLTTRSAVGRKSLLSDNDTNSKNTVVRVSRKIYVR